jgi:hypothetical protein
MNLALLTQSRGGRRDEPPSIGLVIVVEPVVLAAAVVGINIGVHHLRAPCFSKFPPKTYNTT